MATAKQFGDDLIAQLKKSTTDLEEFRVQLALGKAEAKDKFEELKKKFNSTVQSTKQKLTGVAKSRLDEVRGEFEEVQVQLALGKADTLDAFNEQKKKIVRAINKLEKRLENIKLADEVETKIRHAIEKFKIQLEVLRVHYELGKMEAADEFEREKHELTDLVAKLKSKFDARKKSASKARQDRRAELKEAYKHLKKAIVKA